MRPAYWAIVVTLCSAKVATAGGIDRSGQPLDILFRDGNFVEIGYGFTNPDVHGDDISGSVAGIPTDASYNDVAQSFGSVSGGLKYQLTEKISLAFIAAEDFASDVQYDDVAGSNIGGTHAISDTYTLSFIGRYKFTENWSLHGGVRAQWASGDIRLDGNAYGGATFQDGAGNVLAADTVVAATGGLLSGNTVSGYEVEFDQDLAFGFLLGGAYEIPEYALRVSVTYFSPITHNFDTNESFNTRLPPGAGASPAGSVSPSSGKTEVELPQSVNLDFQTGVAKNTLIFGGIRWAEWTAFEISPENFAEASGATLVTLDEDTFTYKLGVAQRLNENWIVSGAFVYEPPGDRLKSPLAPTTGYQQIELGARYTVDKWEIGAGMRYRWLGDAKPETGTPDVARADFRDNTALTLGVRVGYAF